MSDLRITQLDSGLKVATECVPGALSVATGVWVGVGARDEPDSLCGVSHFLEHLLFKGTERRSALDISRAIDRCGGDINAFTTKEYTAYYCRLPARHADIGIELLGDVVTSPALRVADVDTERQVILEEIAMADDNPDDVAHRLAAEQMYLDHPLGRDTAGAAGSVELISAAQVGEFFEQHYRADSMVASIAGPYAHDEMVELARRAFDRIQPGGFSPERVVPHKTGTGVSATDDTEQVHIVVGGRAFHRADSRREALDVVNHVLGGGLSSRLFEEIREKRGLVYSVYSGLGLYSDAGSYSVGASSQPKHADEVLALIVGEIAKLVTNGITDDELDIAKGYLTGSYQLGLEDTGSRMARNGGLLCTRGEVSSVEGQVAKWSAVDHDQVRRVVDDVFRADPLVTTVGPNR